MTGEAVLVDAGPLIALYNPADANHDACVHAMENIPFGKALTCWPVLTEAAYLIGKRLRFRADMLTAVTEGDLVLADLHASDVPPIAAVLRRYGDQQIDLADATLLWLAEREEIDTVLTLDRRHFSVLQTSRGNTLRIIPDP